jgi:hypothetical protein
MDFWNSRAVFVSLLMNDSGDLGKMGLLPFGKGGSALYFGDQTAVRNVNENGNMSDPECRVVRREFLRLAESRGEGKSFCPSEVARALVTHWRPIMPLIRKVGAQMVREGALHCTQKGKQVNAETARGAIRFLKMSNGMSNHTGRQNQDVSLLEKAHE